MSLPFSLVVSPAVSGIPSIAVAGVQDDTRRKQWETWAEEMYADAYVLNRVRADHRDCAGYAITCHGEPATRVTPYPSTAG
jgi:Asp/Glu/hydantoin racemase